MSPPPGNSVGAVPGGRTLCLCRRNAKQSEEQQRSWDRAAETYRSS